MLRDGLTIGIPTYKRPGEVSALVSSLIADGLPDIADILVIDDGPCDETAEALAPFAPEIAFHRHEANQGYCRTFAELFHRCETAHLMITADDDRVLREGVIASHTFARESGADLVSTAWLRDGKVHRGRSDVARIAAGDVPPATNHAPGLLYRTEAVRPLLAPLLARLDAHCHAAAMYPQVIVAYSLVFGGGICFWHPAAPVAEGARAPTNLRDAAGETYHSLPGRYQEHLAFVEFFADMAKADLSGPGRQAATALEQLKRQEVYQLLSTGLAESRPDATADWRGGSLFYSLKRPVRAAKDLTRWIMARRKAHRALNTADAELSAMARKR